MDEEPVFVNESSPDERCGEFRTADGEVARELGPQWASSSPTSPVARRLFQETAARLVENTILGFGYQIRPNSSIGPVAFGSCSAVGQYAAIVSYRRRP